jgi:glycosyltransferase involved in cell wall biosynthesis
MSRSLYICYFGVNEPLVQTQVIPYLRELVKGGHEMSLLTFEPGEIDEKATRESLAADGIEWHWLRYHKRPSVPATLFDVANAVRFIRKLMRERKFDILHARSHVPMMMAALARKVGGCSPKILFDIRGFMPEEFVDGGLWPEGGWVYRSVKRAEKWLMKEADGFVVLTEKAREILAPEIGARPVEVIPCCVDLKRFESANEASRRAVRAELGIGDRFTMAYVGAFGGWYLTEETANFLGFVKRERPDSFALILTQSDPEMIRPLLVERGYSADDYLIGGVPATEIPRYLSAADAAVSFIKNCYSKQASSPTKNAEYLACGLPIVANAGIGDVDELLVETRVGTIVSEMSDAAFISALRDIEGLRDVSKACRETARQEFGLESVGGPRYRKIYGRVG